jgi:threonine dehydrogenase-like Zn-dependent dehydrogenase
MFMQLAKQVYGASLVVTTGSAGKVDLLKSLGVDKVIDYKKEKYEELPDKYDVVFDTVGKLLSLSQISSLYVCNCAETKPQSRCTCRVSVVEAVIICSLSSLIPGIHQKCCQKTPSLKYPTHVTVFVAN